MSLASPTNLREMDDRQLASFYKQCFKSGHTNLFDPPGYKLGTASYIEREVFRRQLIALGWTPKDTTSLDLDTCLRFEIESQRQKFHRSDSHYREYSNISVSKTAGVVFTVDELNHIVEHFSSANDPFVQGLCNKAERMLDALSN